jgi:dienelactone hydrolase
MFELLKPYGVTLVVLEYRLPRGNSEIPLLDAQRMLRHVRYHAKEWKCDPKRVGVMGISAGGHLAATAATSFDDGNPKSDDPVERLSCRPDFAILLCPVITMGTNTHAWSRENLLGRNPTPEMIQRYSAEKQVTEKTCPCFLAHAQDDRDVPPGNSQAFYEALLARKVPAEYVKVPQGGHEMGYCRAPHWNGWKDEMVEWLKKTSIIASNSAGRKILFLGNSITRHPPKADIGWTNNFGMAASAMEKDYVHLLLKRFTDAAGGKAPEARIENAADFEREYATFPIAAKFKELADFKADTVILCIAENVPSLGTQAEQDRFKAAVKELLTFMKGSGSPAIYVRSSFWPDGVKDGILKQVCTELGGTFVDISRLGSDPKNYARSERKFSHDGVAGHPGDAGMAAIAEAIWSAVTGKK